MRYLGLPGTDLIDLRYLHKQLCYDERPPSCASSDSTQRPSAATLRTKSN